MNTENKRLYYLDWLRVLAFGLLFLFHSWRPFDSLPWHIKNDTSNILFDFLTFFTHGWRMYLIFLVSGAGTWYAMKSRRGAFVRDRLKRLIVPFLFGILLIIPPQRFYEWITFRDFQGSYLDFLMIYPTEQLGSNMGASQLLWFGHLGTHIWYLPFLFVMTLMTLPLFKRIQSGQIKFNRLKKVISTKCGVYILIVPMILCRLALKPIFQEYTDWADFFVYTWPFIYGFIFMSDMEFIEIIKKKMWLLLNVGVLSSFLFIYMASQGADMVNAYLHPEFNLLHVMISVSSMVIALSWILFFLAFFARVMNFNHRILIPANISILPIYVLHQSLIIVFGFYIVEWEVSLLLKFIVIVFTAIPVSILIYQVIRTNNVTRFLFGMNALRVSKENSPNKSIITKNNLVNPLTLKNRI